MSDPRDIADQAAEAYHHVPFDIDIEQALIGALFANNKLIDIAAADLDKRHFYDPLHGRVFEMIVHLTTEGDVTPLILHSVMKADPGVIETGGQAYFDALRSAAPAIPNIREYVRILLEHSMRRELLAIADDIKQSVYEPPGEETTAQKIADRATEAMLQAGRAVTGPVITPYDSAMESLAECERIARGETVPMIKMGLHKVDDETGGLRGGDFVVLLGKSGMGKEQPVDTPILTPIGWRTMGDIQPGDLVIGAEGRPVRVSAVWPQGKKQAYRISFRDGTSTECGIEHLWSVAKMTGRDAHKFSTRPLKDIIARGINTPGKKPHLRCSKWKIPVSKPVQYPHATLPIDPYVLGVLIGDGAISGKDLRFSNPDMDADIRQRVFDRLPINTSVRENRSGTCPYFAFSGKGRRYLKNAIVDMGLNVKSGEKFIPSIYKIASSAQRFDLLRGLMDTDGSCLKNRTVFFTSSKQLSNDVAYLVRSLGGIAIQHSHFRKDPLKPQEFCVNVKMDICPFYTARKLAHWKPTPPCRAITNIKPSRIVEQKCITVESVDGLYLTNDFIVTHNTALMGGISRNTALAGTPTLVFSLEMKRSQWVERMVTDMDYDSAPGNGQKAMWYSKVRNGRLSDEEKGRFFLAAGHLKDLPLEIVEADDLTIQQISAKARAFKAKWGKNPDGTERIILILVDYIQIVEASDQRDNRERQVAKIARGLKSIAKRLNAVVMAGSQMNESDAGRAKEEKRPQASDARESKAIMNEADVMFAPFRPAYFVENRKPMDAVSGDPAWIGWMNELKEVRHRFDLLMLKNRHGRRIDFELHCDMGASAIRDQAPRGAMTVQDENAADLLAAL